MNDPNMAIISAAAKTTDLIMDEVQKAYEILSGPFQCNGYGVLTGPTDTRATIRSAIERLKAADSIFEKARWPAHADYGEGE
jgi:hypothetical protein